MYASIIFQSRSNIPLTLESLYKWFNLAVQGQQVVENMKKKLYENIMDGLFMHFFPTSTVLPYLQEDVEFLVKFANNDTLSSDKLHAESASYCCIGLSKMKFHLENVLCKGWNKDGKFAKPLDLYKNEVWK